MRKAIINALTSLALVATPVVASAQTTAPTAPAPAAEEMDGSQIRGGFLLPLAVIVAIIIAILLLTDDGKPKSP